MSTDLREVAHPERVTFGHGGWSKISPDLTPEEAIAIRAHQTLGELVGVLAFVLLLILVALFLGSFLHHRWGVPVDAVGFILIGATHASLAIGKPRIYWESAAALNARMRNSARTITLYTLLFDLAFIAIGVVGVVLALQP